jgi:hypothetical protein
MRDNARASVTRFSPRSGRRSRTSPIPPCSNAALIGPGCGHQGTDAAFAEAGRVDLARDSAEAYARGIFGVPSFVIGDDMFFGNDRLDLLLWDIGRKSV